MKKKSKVNKTVPNDKCPLSKVIAALEETAKTSNYAIASIQKLLIGSVYSPVLDPKTLEDNDMLQIKSYPPTTIPVDINSDLINAVKSLHQIQKKIADVYKDAKFDWPSCIRNTKK